MTNHTEIIPVKLPNGTIIKVELPVEQQGQEVIFEDLDLDFSGFTNAVEGMVDAVAKTLNKVKPDKAKVELGLDLAVEAGQLTALIAKGSGNATMKLTLEWEQRQQKQAVTSNGTTSENVPKQSTT